MTTTPQPSEHIELPAEPDAKAPAPQETPTPLQETPTPPQETPTPPKKSSFATRLLRILTALWCGLKWCFRHWRISLSALIIILLLVCGTWCYRQCGSEPAENAIALSSKGTLTPTAEEIRAMYDIGQWEFLSVETEEMIEKHAAHLLGDAHLVRIYRGTLRLGIDMQHASKDWFTAKGASVLLHLPEITLLDEDFIDETRTVTFHQKGTWQAQTLEEMRAQAAKAMKARAMTKQNLEEARRCAREQFTKVFEAFGYTSVEIYFEPTKQ